MTWPGRRHRRPGVLNLEDDSVYEEVKTLKEQMKAEQTWEKVLKRERKVKELQMELAGIWVGNKETCLNKDMLCDLQFRVRQ